MFLARRYKRQTTWHLRHAATNLPVNEDTSSFAFRVVGRTNFVVRRSPAATLIVIYDCGYFPCTPRIHLLFAYRSTALRDCEWADWYTSAESRLRSMPSSFFSRSSLDMDIHQQHDDLSLIHDHWKHRCYAKRF